MMLKHLKVMLISENQQAPYALKNHLHHMTPSQEMFHQFRINDIFTQNVESILIALVL